MKKFGIVAVLAVGVAGALAPAAGATQPAGPCATQQALFDKYGIGLNMHQAEVEYVYGQACQITG